jgi:hypothetical protein
VLVVRLPFAVVHGNAVEYLLIGSEHVLEVIHFFLIRVHICFPLAVDPVQNHLFFVEIPGKSNELVFLKHGCKLFLVHWEAVGVNAEGDASVKHSLFVLVSEPQLSAFEELKLVHELDRVFLDLVYAEVLYLGSRCVGLREHADEFGELEVFLIEVLVVHKDGLRLYQCLYKC